MVRSAFKAVLPSKCCHPDLLSKKPRSTCPCWEHASGCLWTLAPAIPQAQPQRPVGATSKPITKEQVRHERSWECRWQEERDARGSSAGWGMLG